MQDFAVFQVVLGSGVVSNIILFFLGLMSLGVWGVIWVKYRFFARTVAHNAQFAQRLRSIDSFSRLSELKNLPKKNPMYRVLADVMGEVSKLSSFVSYESIPHRASLLEDAIQRSVESQRLYEEKYLNFLAMCSSIAPFMGLLGTVWGITIAFYEIGRHGNAELAAVAPGIATALVTTIGGLIVAIPASAAYNMFVSRNNKNEVLYYNFGSDLLSLFKRADLDALDQVGNS